MKLLNFITFIIFYITKTLAHNRCIADEIFDKSTVEKVYLHENKRFLQTTAFTPIRIYIDYTTLNSQSISDQVKTNIQTIVNNTVAIYQKLLNVQASTSKLSIQICSSSRQKITLSSNVKAGIDYDIVMFPYYDTSAGSDVEAYAAYCVTDGNTGRPLAGYIGFGNIDFTKTNSLSYYQLLVLHEMNHILSFHESLFPTFIDSNGNTLSNVTTTKVVNGNTRTLLSTPNVVAVAKQYFNCSSLTGVELENQGGSGTAGSHWEARLMLADYMIGQTFPEQAISELTLAVFIDSGWYQVNTYSGGLFRYGKNAGCAFLNNPCVASGSVTNANDFTTSMNIPMCLANHSYKGQSSLVTGLSITSSTYQYFSDKSEGGAISLADYCPIAYANVVDDTTYFPGSCINGELSGFPSSMGEVIGSDSNCFISSLTPSNDNTAAQYKGATNTICYPVICDYTARTYDVIIVNVRFTCPRTGGLVSVAGFDGIFNCPDFNLLCTRSNTCGDTIDCALKGVSPVQSVYDYTPFYSQNTNGTATVATIVSGNVTYSSSSSNTNSNSNSNTNTTKNTSTNSNTNTNSNSTTTNNTVVLGVKGNDAVASGSNSSSTNKSTISNTNAVNIIQSWGLFMLLFLYLI